MAIITKGEKKGEGEREKFYKKGGERGRKNHQLIGGIRRCPLCTIRRI